jgi:type III restriction enzyme
MPKAVITYDKDLPEISNRQPHLPPAAYLRKKPGTADDYEIVEGRRPSQMLLVNRLRKAVDKWRSDGYPGASPVAQRLFTYWFDEDHLLNRESFRFYFGQREAIETLVYLTEIRKERGSKALVQKFGEIFYPQGTQPQLVGTDIEHQTSMDGKNQIRRYIPEIDAITIQDLPDGNLSRHAFKMATGSGKTIVMAMAIVWSFFHKRMVARSPLSTNFLVIAPNVIVYQRLEKDFGSNRIFNALPLIPPEWQGQWGMKVILRGESTEPDPSGNLFLTNIHQVYESRTEAWTPANAVEALLGTKPSKDLSSQERSMLERVKSLPDLVVLNDEAHHVHDEDLQWHKTLTAIHASLSSGLALWLDFSATPKDQNGTYFPWIICDYPLAQAVEDRIVKAPLIVHQVNRKDPENVTQTNITEKYGEWLVAAVERWKKHTKTYQPLKQKPVLFIMAEKNVLADAIGQWLKDNFGFKEKEVLVIHTDREGDVSKDDLDEAREVARDIDLPTSKVKVIVSVLMLREGWDVRNVTVVLGLRPFTSSAKILPEQGVGRGLRLMQGISPDRTQTLEVMGTQAFESFVRQLETEGVGIKTTTKPPDPPVKVEPVLEKAKYDIAIPLTRPVYTHNYKKLSDFDAAKLSPVYDQEDLEETYRIRLKMDFATTETEVHQEDIAAGPPPLPHDILTSITNKTIAAAKLPGGFADLFPIVRQYVTQRCFGKTIDLEDPKIREYLRAVLVQEGIAKYLARKIAELTAEKRAIQFEQKDFKLSDVRPFTWRRNLPLLDCQKTIFNLVATFNDYEKDFARFLEGCPDVHRFASFGTTEQDSGAQFRVDYLKPSGAIGFYYPDWVAVQKTDAGEVNWIIETKGRIWESTPAKDAAIADWCKKITAQTGTMWRYKRVDQIVFGAGNFPTFADLITAADAHAADPTPPPTDFSLHEPPAEYQAAADPQDPQTAPEPADCDSLAPSEGDHVPQSGPPTSGTHLVAGLGSHWAGLRGPKRSTLDAPRSQPTAVSIADTNRDDVMCEIRRLFNTGGPRDRETALRQLSEALGYQRLGPNIREILSTDLLTAVRRGILENDAGQLRICARNIEDYTRDSLKEDFLAAVGRTWTERDDAIRAFARRIGYARTGQTIENLARSLINGLIREDRLESDGTLIRRKVA